AGPARRVLLPRVHPRPPPGHRRPGRGALRRPWARAVGRRAAPIHDPPALGGDHDPMQGRRLSRPGMITVTREATNRDWTTLELDREEEQWILGALALEPGTAPGMTWAWAAPSPDDTTS